MYSPLEHATLLTALGTGTPQTLVSLPLVNRTVFSMKLFQPVYATPTIPANLTAAERRNLTLSMVAMLLQLPEAVSSAVSSLGFFPCQLDVFTKDPLAENNTQWSSDQPAATVVLPGASNLAWSFADTSVITVPDHTFELRCTPDWSYVDQGSYAAGYVSVLLSRAEDLR